MQSFLEFLLYSSLLLLIGGCVVVLLLRFTGCQSPKWNRFAWAFVLLLGVAAVRVPLELPVLSPHLGGTPAEEQSRNLQIAESSAPLVAEGHSNSAPLYPYWEDDKGIRAQNEDDAVLLRAHQPAENPVIEIAESTQRNLKIAALFVLWLSGTFILLIHLTLSIRSVRKMLAILHTS